MPERKFTYLLFFTLLYFTLLTDLLYYLFLKEAEPGEVLKILNSLNIKKSSDIFGISLKLIKIAAENLKAHISVIFNCLIHQGVLPSKLKIGFIRPIYKNKSKTMCSNYQPISILPIITKVFEKLMHKRLYDFIKKNTT